MRSKVVIFRCIAPLKHRLRLHSKEKGVSMSYVLRKALREYLERNVTPPRQDESKKTSIDQYFAAKEPSGSGSKGSNIDHRSK